MAESFIATLHQLRNLLGIFFFVAHYGPAARFFLNHTLETLKACQAMGLVQLSARFQKYLNWFGAYLQSSNRLYIMHEGNRHPILLFINACATGAGAICGK